MSQPTGIYLVASDNSSDMDTKTKLKMLCDERGWSQAELLRQAGDPITASTYSAYLKSSKTDLTFKTAYALAKALGVDLNWLADDAESMPPRRLVPEPLALAEGDKEVLRIALLLGQERAIRRLLGIITPEDVRPASWD